MMRVLFVTRKWPPAVGGMETYSVELARELGHLCDLSVRSLPGRADGRPPSTFALVRFTLASMMAIAAGRRVDAIHIGDLVLWPLAVVARVFQPAARLVIAAHGRDIGFTMYRGVLPSIYRLYITLCVGICPRTMRVIANSQYTAQCCISTGFRDVRIVTLGVTVLEDDDEIEEPGLYLLFVGRLTRQKGAAWFIENVLPLISPETRLIVVGPLWDDSEWRTIASVSRVVYGGVVTSREKLRRLRRNALAVVMPNIPTGPHYEGFGLTALEAAADGGVLLASRLGGIVDAVVEGETGFLLPPLDAEAWAAQVLAVGQWPHYKRGVFVRRAQQTVQSRFSWSGVAQRTLEIYSDAGNGSNP